MTKNIIACIDNRVLEVNVSAKFNLRDALRHAIGQAVVVYKTDAAKMINLEVGAIQCRHLEPDSDRGNTAGVLYLIVCATSLPSYIVIEALFVSVRTQGTLTIENANVNHLDP